MFAKLNKIKIFLLVLIIGFLPANGWTKTAEDFDINRARLLGHMIQQQLSENHYSQKAMDDSVSHAAFDLYLKQLDFQKRFLLLQDVAYLKSFQDQIDDAIRRGRLDLPRIGHNLLNIRIEQIQDQLEDLLKEKIDPTVDEMVETDSEKLDFVATGKELRERWRKIIKFQILSRYINLREEEGGVDEKGALKPVDEKTEQELLGKALERVEKNIRSMLTRMLEETEQDHYDRYLNAITRAFDPHTNYLPPTSKEDFDIQMSGSLEGIGATLREDDGFIKVVRIIPGSAAYRQGQLEADDTILKVAEGSEEPVDIADTRIRDAVELIRGKKGTEVRLTVKKPDGRRVVIPIVRDVVEIEETFVKGTTTLDKQNGLKFGYVKVPSFYRDYTGKTQRNCTDDLRDELKRLKKEKIAGLILDLRNNGGGSLADAVSMTGLFIETGPVVQVRDAKGRISVMQDDDRSVEYDGPLVVLVNRFSASASEILAGALQDYGRAMIVGDEHTHGKGTVQALLDLDRYVSLRGMEKYMPLGAVKVTIQKFYRISGESTQEKGVIPDVVLPSRLDGLESGEKYLEFALPWDTINSADYRRWRSPPKNLNQLRKDSKDRISKEKEFQEIILEGQEGQKNRQETRQSLLLKTMLKERDQLSAFSKGDFSHGSQMGKNGKKDKESKTLDEEIAEDPYVGEGIALLNELLGGQS